jgi:hypothetical protein
MPKDKIFGDDVKKGESRTQGFLKTIIQSCNPGKYPGLVSRTWRQAFDYLLTLIFFLVFMLFVISIYRFAQFEANFGKEMDKFSRFDIKVDYLLEEPIHYGGFVMDNERNYTTERLLITKDGISSHSLFCLLLSPACIFEDSPATMTSAQLSDVLGYSGEIKGILAFMMVLLLPGLLLFFLMFFALKFMLIISIAAILAFIITRISRFEITLKQIFLAAVYSATIMIVMEGISFYFHWFFWVPIVAYMILYTIVVMMVGEREHAYAKER